MLDARSAAPTGHDVQKDVLLERQEAPEAEVLFDQRRHRGRGFRRIPLGLAEVDPRVRGAAHREIRGRHVDAGEDRGVREDVVVGRDEVIGLPVARRLERRRRVLPPCRQLEPDLRGTMRRFDQRDVGGRADDHRGRLGHAVREVASARR